MVCRKRFNCYLVNQVRLRKGKRYLLKLFIVITIAIYQTYYISNRFIICIGVRPLNQLSAYTNQHIPGVTLTTCNFESNYDSTPWPGSRKIGTSRCWPQDSHSSDHSDQSGQRESDQSAHSGEHRDSGTV